MMNAAIQQTISERRRGRVIASPRARRAMRQRGIDAAWVRGSGPGGRIVEADVLAAGASGRAPTGTASPHRAQFWLQATADVSSLLEIQGQIAEEVQRSCGVPLRLADFLLRAMGLALADCPRANRVWQGEQCVDRATADVGLEVESASRRVVQVVPRADQLRLLELVSRRADATQADQPAASSLCDLTDYPIDQYVAVLTPPRTSVLAAGRPTLRPEKGTGPFCLQGPQGAAHKMDLSPFPVLRPSLCLSLTADASALSPETAAAYLGRIVELLEHPFLLLCERLPR